MMQMIGVEAFVCDDFREGNIICDVQIVSGIAPSNNLLDRLYRAPHSTAEQDYHDRHHLLVARKVENIKAGSLFLVVLNPSYGCDLRALCQEVIIVSHEQAQPR